MNLISISIVMLWLLCSIYEVPFISILATQCQNIRKIINSLTGRKIKDAIRNQRILIRMTCKQSLILLKNGGK